MSDHKRRAKSTSWWRTPKTQAFIQAQEALEAAYDDLMKIEADVHQQVAQQMVRRRRDSSTLLQSLNNECIQFLLRQRLAQSSAWQEAWQRFTEATIRAEQARQEFREDIEESIHRKRPTYGSYSP